MKKTIKRFLTIGAIAALLMATLVGCDIFIFLGFLEGDTDFTVVLEWDDNTEDLELYVTAPDYLSVGAVDFAEPLDNYTDIREAFDGSLTTYTGFYPEPGTFRTSVDYSNPVDGYGNSVTYEAHDSTTRLIEVTDLPVNFTGSFPNANDTTPGTYNGLLADYSASDNLALVGVMEIYVLASSGNVRDAGDPELSIYNSSDSLIAKFPLDEQAGIKGMSVVRILFFRDDSGRNYYQYLIDKRNILDETDVRSIGGNDDYIVLGSFGRER